MVELETLLNEILACRVRADLFPFATFKLVQEHLD